MKTRIFLIICTFQQFFFNRKVVINLDAFNNSNDKTPEEEWNAIRDRIFQLLESEPISQKEFAKIVEVSPQTITDWKKGKSRSYMQKLPIIAYALRSTTEWLFLGRGPKSQLEKTRETAREHLLKELEPSTPAPKETLQAAFWGGEKDLSQEDLDDMWNDVERFAAFLAEKKRQEKKDG